MIILILENDIWDYLPYIQTKLYDKNDDEPVDGFFSLLKIPELDAHNERMDQFQGFDRNWLTGHWPSTSSKVFLNNAEFYRALQHHILCRLP